MGLAMLLSAGCALPCLGALYFFRDAIMAGYGRGFVGHGDVLVLSALSAGLLAIQTPVGNIITAMGRMWTGAAMNAGLGLSLVISAHQFAQMGMGAKGLAA